MIQSIYSKLKANYSLNYFIIRWKILANNNLTYRLKGIKNGLNTLQYEVKEIKKNLLFTHILINHTEY